MDAMTLTPGSEDLTTAAAVLRTRLLDDLDDEVWPMDHVELIIDHYKLAETAEERQVLALDVLRSLLREKLILVGDVVGGDPAYINPWPGTPEDILDRIRSLYVDHYDDAVKWDLSIWISLNDERKIWRNNVID